MTSADVFAQIERMGDLPSLPQTLLRVQKVANDDRADWREAFLARVQRGGVERVLL